MKGIQEQDTCVCNFEYKNQTWWKELQSRTVFQTWRHEVHCWKNAIFQNKQGYSNVLQTWPSVMWPSPSQYTLINTFTTLFSTSFTPLTVQNQQPQANNMKPQQQKAQEKGAMYTQSNGEMIAYTCCPQHTAFIQTQYTQYTPAEDLCDHALPEINTNLIMYR